MTEDLDNVRQIMGEAETVAPNPDVMTGSAPPRTPPDDLENHPPEAPEPTPIEVSALFPLNDFGNGQRFVVHFGEHSMFVPRVGWFCWDGKHWVKDADELRIRGRAQQVSGLISEEIQFLALEDWEQDIVAREEDLNVDKMRIRDIRLEDRTADQKKELTEIESSLGFIEALKKRLTAMRKSHRAHARGSGNSGPIKNMLLESSVAISQTFEALDADPLVINTQSGSLHFSRKDDAHAKEWGKPGEPVEQIVNMELRAHDPAELLTQIMPVVYDPDAKCPEFDTFLARIQPDAEMRKFLQRWFGLSMTALTGEQKLSFFYGSGSNGKSVLVDLIAKLMAGYSATAKIETLTGKNRRGGGDATPDLVPLMPARMVRASEPEEGIRFQEGLIKELTGGESMLIRALHADFIEVYPKFKLTISGNHKPEIRGTDDGIWRRLLLVPFEVQIPKAERDKELGNRLWANERSGVLNWLIAGLTDYLENGLQEPDAVLLATQGFRDESDPVHAFLCDCCQGTGSEQDFLSSRELMESFNFWLEDNGKTRWTPTQASRKIKAKAGKWRDPNTRKMFKYIKRSSSGYLGIKLITEFKDRMTEVDLERSSRRYGSRD